jgi:hypothetical protein
MIPRVSPSIKVLAPADPLSIIFNQVLIECRVALAATPCQAIAINDYTIVISIKRKPSVDFEFHRYPRTYISVTRCSEEPYPEYVATAVDRALGLLQRQRIPIK